MTLNAYACELPSKPRPVSPIVVRYQFDPELVATKSEGYRLLAEMPGKMPFVFRVFNLSSEPQERSFGLTFSQAVAFETEEFLEMTIPAAGHVDVRWDVDLSGAFSATGRLAAMVSSAGSGSEPAELVEIDLMGNPIDQKKLDKELNKLANQIAAKRKRLH